MQQQTAIEDAPLRALTGVLLVGGIALAVLAQTAAAAVPAEARPAVWTLALVGALLFVFGSLQMAGGRVSRETARLLERPAAWLAVTPAQLVLLALALPLALLARLAAGNADLAHHAPVATGAWLTACVLVVLGSRRSGEAGPRFSRREIALIALLFGAAFAVRGLATGSIPTTLSGDEGSAGLSALRFLTGKQDNLFSIGWFSFPSLFYALNSIGIVLLGRTPEALRLLSSLAGAVTVVALYLLGRAMFGRTTGALAALLLLAGHFHIHFSRIGLQNIWDGLFAVIALGGLWVGWQHGRRSGLILCGLAFGLGQYFYVTMRALPAVVLLWLLLVGLRDPQRLRTRLPDLLLAGWIALIVALPLLLYFVDQPQEFNAPLQRVTILDGWLTEQTALRGQSAALVLFDQLILSARGLVSLPLRHWYEVDRPLLLPAQAALFLLGLLLALLRWDRRHALLLLTLAAVLAAGSLSRDAPAAQRYVLIAPLIALYVALPLSVTADWLRAAWPQQRRGVLAATLAVVLVLMSIDLQFYFGHVTRTFVLGGANTATAMRLVDYLVDRPGGTLYFAGWPRMNYASIASVPYLLPDWSAEDLMEPLTAPPTWQAAAPGLFIFLPERLTELAFVQQAYPGGRLERITADDGSIWFIAYWTASADASGP